MNTIQAIVLGLVQGLSEFLPISSSGHLVLIPYLFGWTDPGLGFDVALHMGTLFAVLLFFWRDWFAILKQLTGLGGRDKNSVQWPLLVVGTIPAVIAGLLLEKYAEETFRNPLLIAATLAGFGILLWYWDRNGRKTRDLTSLTYRDALTIGAAQAIAIIPGSSRSGVTITAALLLGFMRPAAIRFSFLLAAPITAGAGLMKSKYMLNTITTGGPEAVAVAWGFLTSLLAGLLAIGLLNYIVKSNTFNGFVAYRLLLSLVIVIIIIFR